MGGEEVGGEEVGGEEEGEAEGEVVSRPPPPFAQFVTEYILDWGARATPPKAFCARDVREWFTSLRKDSTNGLKTAELTRAGRAAQTSAEVLFTTYLPNAGSSDFDERDVMAFGAPPGPPPRHGYGNNHAHIQHLLLAIKQGLSRMAGCYVGDDICALPQGLLAEYQKYSAEPVLATGEASPPPRSADG